MSNSYQWNQWEGLYYPATLLDPTIYFHKGIIDIENPDILLALIEELHADGVVPSKADGIEALNSAIVVHGRFIEDTEGVCIFDEGYDEASRALPATWVEFDRYEN